MSSTQFPQKFNFRTPPFFQSAFKDEQALWASATLPDPPTAEDAVDDLFKQGRIDPKYVRYLLVQRYLALRQFAPVQIAKASAAPTASTNEMKRLRHADPAGYQVELAKIESKKAAKVYLPMLKLNVPGYGDVALSELTLAHVREWEEQARLLHAKADTYLETRAPFIQLLRRFPKAKKLGDIPNWENELDKYNPTWRSVRQSA